MKQLGVVLVVIACFVPRESSAAPILYQYVQTGAHHVPSGDPRPDFLVSATLLINGTFSDLPTLNCLVGTVAPPLPPTPGCLAGFGNLLALNVNTPIGPPAPDVVTLLDFDAFGLFGESWSISPTAIALNQNSYQIVLNLVDGSIRAGTDGLSSPGCGNTNCVATGSWVATPEPSSLLLMTGGVAALVRRRFRRKS